MSCLLCDSTGPFELLYERDGHRLVRCECGLAFEDPQPAEATLAASYYHDEDYSAALLGSLRESTLRTARAKLALLRRAGIRVEGMRVLDVGCSSGAWIEVAADAGMAATGVEIGERTAADARARGLDVHTGTLAEAAPRLAGERFDLITFWDVLEHLRDPREELALARELLAPGGHIAMTFPNLGGLFPRLTRRTLGRATRVWEHPELPLHMYDFSPDSAGRLLEAAGFRVQLVRTSAIPLRHLLETSLAPARTGYGMRGLVIRGAFRALAAVAYPAARMTNRGNSMFIVARPDAARPTSRRPSAGPPPPPPPFARPRRSGATQPCTPRPPVPRSPRPPQSRPGSDPPQ